MTMWSRSQDVNRKDAGISVSTDFISVDGRVERQTIRGVVRDATMGIATRIRGPDGFAETAPLSKSPILFRQIPCWSRITKIRHQTRFDEDDLSLSNSIVHGASNEASSLVPWQ
jgi:hypothetical protein